MNYTLNTFQSKKFNTISAALIIKTPLTKKNATYNTLLSAVLKSGSEKYPSGKEINKFLEHNYGIVFHADILKKGNCHLIEFYIESICDCFENGIEFLSEILLNPRIKYNEFDEKIFNIEKENMKNIIKSRIDNKRLYAQNRCLEETFGGENFGVYADGYSEILEKITPQSLFSYYKTLLFTPIDFFTAGNISKNSVTAMLRKHFPSFSPSSFLPLSPEEKKINSKEKIIRETTDLSQAKLCITYRINGDFLPMLIGNEILGGAGNSVLFSDVREKEGLCYYISSTIYRFSQIIMIQAGIESKNADKTIEIIKKSVDAVKSGNFKDNHLETAKKTLISGYTTLFDTGSSILDFSLSSAMAEDNKTSEDIIEIIKNTDKETIVKAFEKMHLDTIYLLEAENNA